MKLLLILTVIVVTLAAFEAKKTKGDVKRNTMKKGNAVAKEYESMANEVVKQNKGRSSQNANGNALKKTNEKKNKHDKVTRMEQEFEGFPVFGASMSVVETEAHEVELIDKATGKGTGKKVRVPATTNVEGVVFEGLKGLAKKSDLMTMKKNAGAMLRRIKGQKKRGTDAKNPGLEDSVTPTVFVDENGVAHTAYWARFYSEDGSGNPAYLNVIVDEDGTVLKEFNGLNTNKVGTGPGGNAKIGQYTFGQNGLEMIDVVQTDTTCKYDTPNVQTIHLANSWSHSGGTAFTYTCPLQSGDEVNGGYSALNDAQFFGTKVFEMYKSWYSTAPLTSTPLQLKVHLGSGYENAFWTGVYMGFGDGASYFHPLTSLDVVAHEVSHGVTGQSSGLIYAGESGGLNEAFSDMAGKAAERFVRGFEALKWGVGFDIVKSATGSLRCMDNPPCDGASIDHVSKYHSEMDVHHSSGIFNKVFYLLSNKFAFDAWDAFDLFYVANTKLWQSGTTFREAAALTMKALDQMKRSMHLPSDYSWINTQDVVDAFTTVGITCTGSGENWTCT